MVINDEVEIYLLDILCHKSKGYGLDIAFMLGMGKNLL